MLNKARTTILVWAIIGMLGQVATAVPRCADLLEATYKLDNAYQVDFVLFACVSDLSEKVRAVQLKVPGVSETTDDPDGCPRIATTDGTLLWDTPERVRIEERVLLLHGQPGQTTRFALWNSSGTAKKNPGASRAEWRARTPESFEEQAEAWKHGWYSARRERAVLGYLPMSAYVAESLRNDPTASEQELNGVVHAQAPSLGVSADIEPLSGRILCVVLSDASGAWIRCTAKEWLDVADPMNLHPKRWVQETKTSESGSSVKGGRIFEYRNWRRVSRPSATVFEWTSIADNALDVYAQELLSVGHDGSIQRSAYTPLPVDAPSGVPKAMNGELVRDMQADPVRLSLLIAAGVLATGAGLVWLRRRIR